MQNAVFNIIRSRIKLIYVHFRFIVNPKLLRQ
jgi:hypothetical protein